MKRVVVTGYGIVSCLGNDRDAVLDSLKQGRSGIKFQQDYVDMGMRSHIAGSIDIDIDALIDRKVKRFMGDSAAYAYISMQQAIEHAGLSDDMVSNTRTGIIMGSGGGSSSNQVEAADILRNKGLRRVGPYMVPRTMSSTVSACLATPFHIKGVNYSISSACATSTHCIGNAYELIQMGKQDIIFAGGGEEEHWSLSMMFDAMGALSTNFNDSPEKASRTYDADRDGFVIAGGGGAMVVEELEHARSRGANIIAEIVGYGATSDGVDMVAPSGEGAVRCMKMATEHLEQPLDYINTHGTSTPVGDTKELEAIHQTFGDNIPPISSSKSLAGHSLGASGVQEAIYSLLMVENNFIQASANIDNLDEAAAGMPIVTARQDNVELNTVMSNNFGFGGTNACLVFQKYTG
jgi:3-oxoacyl-[acyl-carrier-protein] synthase-1